LRALPYRICKTLNPNLKIDKVSIIGGNTIYLDENDSLNLAWYRVYEWFETQVILNQINPGDVVLDLGAFIGYYTVLFANKVGQRGHVFAFEPRPTNFKILSKNTEKRFIDNITIEEKAISIDTGNTTLYLCNNNHGMNRIYPSVYCDGSAFGGKVEVDTIKLDEYFGSFKKPINFVKMDLEGSEFGALEGMKDIINKNINIKIYLEFHPDSIREYGKDPKELLEFLHSYGFSLFHIDNITRTIDKIDPFISDESVEGFIDKANARIPCNLLCQIEKK
jgi:FkbM family methyltransferase